MLFCQYQSREHSFVLSFYPFSFGQRTSPFYWNHSDAFQASCSVPYQPPEFVPAKPRTSSSVALTETNNHPGKSRSRQELFLPLIFLRCYNTTVKASPHRVHLLRWL